MQLNVALRTQDAALVSDSRAIKLVVDLIKLQQIFNKAPRGLQNI